MEPIQVTITMGDRDKILVTEVLRRTRGQVHGLVDSHGVEAGAAAVEQVAAELGIDLGPMEED